MQIAPPPATGAPMARVVQYEKAAREHTEEARSRGIQSVDRALSIIEVLSLSDAPLMLKDVSKLSDLNLSTCHHLITTLVRRGYVIHAGRAQGYALSSKFEILSRRSEREVDLVTFVKPRLIELNENILEAVQMAVLRGSALVSHVRLPARMRASENVFDRPLTHAAHAVATGKAILAWLPEGELGRVMDDNGLTAFTEATITSRKALTEELRLVRRSGFAVEDGEFHPDLVGIAAAVRDLSGAVVGSIGATFPRRRASEAYRAHVAKAISTCAKDLSGRMPAGCFV
ncbi:IclR family transcriptional regulator [Amaricoccus solimangrovi]|uniref:IclR family transcriptional regulator n=1 Tax=Amaricoccus solimangrovi TaxID=2589815 RepID=A0A501WIG2_9RHOB|nr:IclR family transcriptional regulator [Amaricoccus solimangrovi]TPE49673.1 IclR family transcriptional regulator [Amaricoccus solimangrovi]